MGSSYHWIPTFYYCMPSLHPKWFSSSLLASLKLAPSLPTIIFCLFLSFSQNLSSSLPPILPYHPFFLYFTLPSYISPSPFLPPFLPAFCPSLPSPIS